MDFAEYKILRNILKKDQKEEREEEKRRHPTITKNTYLMHFKCVCVCVCMYVFVSVCVCVHVHACVCGVCERERGREEGVVMPVTIHSASPGIPMK